MQRFLSALFGMAFVTTLGSGAGFAATAAKGSAMSSMSTMKCAKGSSYVKGYKSKSGKMVKGYCRADKKSSSTMMKKSK